MEVGVFIAYFFAGNEVVPILVERHEGRHVVFTVVANWCIGCGVVRLFWLVPSQPLFIDAKDTGVNSKQALIYKTNLDYTQMRDVPYMLLRARKCSISHGYSSPIYEGMM